MKWSWKIGSVTGIPIYVHSTFVLILLWVVWRSEGEGLFGTLTSLAFILTLFTCVVLHELGHALTACLYGIKPSDITLLPIGGVARLEKMPEEPRQDFWVAVAGPAVNVVIALMLFVVLLIEGEYQPTTSMSITAGSFLERIMAINLVLVLFNMLPAFPMDGGRVLRAVLALSLIHI